MPYKNNELDFDIISMLSLMDGELKAKQKGTNIPKPKTDAVKRIKKLTQPILPKQEISRATGTKQKRRPKRYDFKGKVIIVKNDRYIKGLAVNISKTGIFVHTKLKIFNENETARIHIKPHGMEKTFKAICKVVRFQDDERGIPGYGLQFIKSSH